MVVQRPLKCVLNGRLGVLSSATAAVTCWEKQQHPLHQTGECEGRGTTRFSAEDNKEVSLRGVGMGAAVVPILENTPSLSLSKKRGWGVGGVPWLWVPSAAPLA